MRSVEPGDLIEIHYVGRLENGQQFDSSRGGPPLEFAAGSDEMISGVSRAVIGMNPGERRTVEVLPEEAYGNAGPDAREQIGRGDLPAGVEVGDRVSLTTDRGRCNFWITRLDDDSAELSRNHPLAGQKLIFELELVRVLPDDRS